MAQNPTTPANRPDAHVAPNTQYNLLGETITFAGALLWPAFLHPPDGMPANQDGTIAAVQNHWHVTPGRLNAYPTAPAWAAAEALTAAGYHYDKRYVGAPLANVDVDLFDARVGIDFDDYAKLKDLYEQGQGDESARQRTLAQRVGMTRTDASGRFAFRGLRAGDYLLVMRGRVAIVENKNPGGEVSPAAENKHNGVETAALSSARGAHPLSAKIRIDAQGAATIFIKRDGAEVAYPIQRLLDPGKTQADVRIDTPYRFYALPLVVRSNTAQRDACKAQLAHAFNVEEARAETAIDAVAMLDLGALATFPTAEQPPAAVMPEGTIEEVMKRTLFIAGEGQNPRTMAWDHVYWCFLAQADVVKNRGRFAPVDNAGVFAGEHLYGAATKTKDSYGRYALRFIDGAVLTGRDIRELKIRLCLWGSATNFVDLRNDQLNAAVRDALLRFKRDRELFRRRVNGARNAVDDPASVVTSIVDRETYEALDTATPSVTLASVAERRDPRMMGTALLTEEGYDRILFYAVEIARRRIVRSNAVNVHSSFRTVAGNRRVYLQPGHELHWRLASNAPSQVMEHGGFTTTIQGTRGRDGSTHTAGQRATNADVIWDAPRGTYYGERGAEWAADYSKHTTGRAIDYDYTRGSDGQIQWDNNAMVLFGASRPAHVAGRLWLEPAAGGGGAGTSGWIHLDTGDLPNNIPEYVLTEEDAAGPRWNSAIIVRGRVTRNGSARLGARVQLMRAGAVVATTYADARGDYSVRFAGPSTDVYTVQASFVPGYPYQATPANPPARVSSAVTPVAITWAGAENTVNLAIV